ncbi:MAG: TfoX/Sxy family protein [Alphaproteobacteria bacterium]|nr:TfoX/Sxy family protein [Alphaproteobacteria bacterium]
MASRSAGDFDNLADLFAGFGPVTIRRMFGGAGVFADGPMIALVVDGVIFLKADAATIPPFEREGMAPFNYGTTRGTRTLTSYWRMPERLYDDADELAGWARHAMDAARRSGGKSSKRKKS